MRIGKVSPRRDGKFLVTILFGHGTIRRKIYTAEQLADARAKVEAHKAQEAAYFSDT